MAIERGFEIITLTGVLYFISFYGPRGYKPSMSAILYNDVTLKDDAPS